MVGWWRWGLGILAVVVLVAAGGAALVVAAGGTGAPSVLPIEPSRDKEVAVSTPLAITFDRPMLAPLAERALHIQPAVEGSFSWQGNTMLFTPRTGWGRGIRYAFTLDQTARGLFPLPLKEPVSYQFMTAKELAVVTVQPADGAVEVAPSNAIAVQFSYPVVALGTTGGDPNPLRIEPEVKGKGRWLTTSLYLFQPEGGLAPGVHYSILLPKGLKDTGGSTLVSDYRWSFSTKGPSVSAVSPEANTRYVGPKAEVRVTFDQPVDHPSVEERFSLEEQGSGAVAGKVAWEGDTLVFRPGAPLKLATGYSAEVAAGFKSAGGAGDGKAFAWSFTTVGTPKVVSTTPAQGSVNHRPFDSVQIVFSNPMDTDSVEKALSISPKPPQWNPNWQDSDSALSIWGGLKPSTQYTLTVGGDAVDRYGQKLAAPLRLTFTTAPLPPRVSAAIPGFVGTFNAAGTPTLYVEHVNVSRLDFSLYRVDQATFARLSTDGRARDQFSPDPSSLVRSWSESLAGDRNQVSLTSTTLGASGSKLGAGYYFIRIGSPEKAGDSRLLVVSRLGLTMKRTERQVLVWATDLTSGQVVPGLPIRITDNAGGTLAQGKTDKDGVLLVDNLPRQTGPRRLVQLFAFAEGEGDPGAVSTDWSNGIHPYELGVRWDPSPQSYRGELYTDRPVYRPGQKVLFKGIVRGDDDGRYSLPRQGTEVALTVTDSQGRKVQSDTAKLSDMGSFDGELALSPDATLGNYYVSAKIGDYGFGVGFSVAEYRKPEFEVKVAADKTAYVNGDQISVVGGATYYFGQPVASSPVKVRVTSDNYFFSALDGSYQFVDYDLARDARMQGERPRTESQGTADADGGFAFQFPADLSKDAMSQQFTIEYTIQDANNQEVSAATRVIVHKGEYYPGLRPERYVTRVGDPAAVDLVVVDKDGKPVPNSQVAVSFFNRKWLSVKEKQPDGSYFWTSKPEDTLLSQRTVVTDGDGRAKAMLEAKEAGSIRVVAEVTDPRSNRVRSATYLYVSGSGFAAWRMESTDRIELVPDKKEYNTGETARVLVPSPVEDTTALITIERGKVLSYRLARLKGNSEILDVPILGEYVPNVYVSAVLFKGGGGGSEVPTFKVGYAELPVSVADKALKVSVTPNKARYEPGEKATFAVKTTDASGKGVPAELSLAVVDASVLALADSNARDLMDTFWSQRPVGVSTSGSLSVSVDRFNADVTRDSKGAGGGGETPTVRQEFPDTAYWNPSLRTDDRGEATVSMTMPDSLTTWRTTARGITAATQVGSATVDTVASKSLLLRPAFPRFLLMGDHLKLATLLHNYTDQEVDAEVTLSATGVQSEDAKGFAPQRVKVKPGDVHRLEWPAVVDSVPGGGSTAKLTVTARPVAGSAPRDSVEITLPVNTLTTAEVVATSGEVRDSTTELVRVPAGANPALGELTVETSPSLAAGMRYSARFLDEFPYECTEQTVSRFLPRVVMQRAFDKLGLQDREGIAGKLPGIVGKSLQKLYAGQRPDGGWGWWPGDGSDQWITAYVVQGLAEARRSGYSVDQGVLDRAAEYLRRSLDAPTDVEHPENPNSRAYVLYALALAGKGDLGLTNALYDRGSILGNYGKGYLVLALQTLNASSQDGKVKSLVSDLSSSAIASATGSHWEESEVDYRTMNTSTRSTAVVLDALVKTVPDSSLIPSTVRWLMVARKDGHWETTQETAASLLALTDYLEASGELKGDFGYRVGLNGKELSTETVNRDNLEEERRLVVAVRDLISGDNRLSVDRAIPAAGQSGEGKLYYTMRLRYFLPGEQVPATSDGLALIREYYKLGDEAAGPVAKVAAGDTVKVKLTVVALQDMHYLVVEDPLPSGLEAVDTRLKTTSLVAQQETGGRQKVDGGKEGVKGKSGPAWWQYDYFNHVEPRDDRVALFATYLPRGTYEYSYLARATSSGEFQALPARGYEMYFPEVGGRSEGSELMVGGQ